MTSTIFGFFAIVPLSSPPTIIVNPGAVATYTCEDPDNILFFMGESRLTCTRVGDTAVWVPDVAPSCPGTNTD